jgi:hypothetical protein
MSHTVVTDSAPVTPHTAPLNISSANSAAGPLEPIETLDFNAVGSFYPRMVTAAIDDMEYLIYGEEAKVT